MFLSRQRLRTKRLAVVAAILLLLTFCGLVSPFSALPNPIGLYHLIVGGYEYVPDTQSVNRFALVGSIDPRPKLIPQLDSLIGKIGLDPLDPIQPLVSYQFRRLLTRPHGLDFEAAAADVEFRYADGSVRTYSIPVYDRVLPHEDRSRWRYSGLGRTLAINEELPWLPFGNERTALALGEPTRATTEEPSGIASGPQWSAAYLGMGDWPGAMRVLPDNQGLLLLRPEGNNFGHSIAAQQPDAAVTLWLVPEDGTPARRIDQDVLRVTNDPSGRFVVYTRWRDARRPTEGFHVTIYDRLTNSRRTVGKADTEDTAIAGEAAYFLNGGVFLRVSLASGPAREILTRADARGPQTSRTPSALAVSPDGARIAYRCAVDLCLTDIDGQNVARIPLEYVIPSGRELSWWRYESFGLAWSADGRRLAVTVVGCCEGGNHRPYATPKMLVVDRGGHLLQEFAIGPGGRLGEPQWTPDGRFVLLNAFPHGGRRIVAVDTTAGAVADLSQPSWDAIIGLTPDGKTLAIWNGRGGIWSVPLLRR